MIEIKQQKAITTPGTVRIMGDMWFPESRNQDQSQKLEPWWELPTGSWVYQGTLENRVMARTKPPPEMETRPELSQIPRNIPASPLVLVSSTRPYRSSLTQKPAGGRPGKGDFLQHRAKHGIMRWGGEMSVSLAHNVNISNHSLMFSISSSQSFIHWAVRWSTYVQNNLFLLYVQNNLF